MNQETTTPVSEKILDLIGQKMMKKEPMGRHEPAHVRAAFMRLVAKTPGLSPASEDATRAFMGYINLGSRTGLANTGERESAFLAARVRLVANAHGRVAVVASDAARPWCDALGVPGPLDDEDLSGRPAIRVASGKTAHVTISFIADAGCDPAFAEAYAGLAKADLKPVPGAMTAIEAAFSPFLDAIAERRFVKATYAGETAKPDAVNHVFDRWTPRLVEFPGMKPHPAALIEAKTLASVRVPLGRITPRIPEKAIQSGALSDAQLETVALAVNAHERRIEISTGGQTFRARQGFLIADGTGTGKTNEIAGIVADSWNRGRRRHVVVVEKDGHIANFRKAFRMIGLDAPISRFGDVRSTAGRITSSTGVVILTYASLRTVDRHDAYPVVEALVEWMANGGLDGVMVFDESQNLRNSADSIEAGDQLGDAKGQWKKEASHQALAACELQDSILDARVVYASATSATELNNLAYMSRLGVWGPGTPYKHFLHFAKQYRDTSMSLETVPLHLKSTGVMTSRTLSLEGVDYGLIQHNLNLVQTEHYQALTSLITRTKQITARYLEAAQKVTKDQKSSQMRHIGHDDHPSYSAHASVMQALSNISTRILDATDVAMMMPSVLADTDQARDRGEAPIFQISNTNEAETRRSIASGRESGDETAITDQAVAFVEDVLIASFKHLKNQGAASKALQPSIADLVAEWKALPNLPSPLDQIMMHYGPNEIAEVTGRSVRRVPADPSDPSRGFVIETRRDGAALEDHADFMADRKMGCVFSVAFGGSGYDYHSSRDCRNQRKRYHVVIECGRQADVAIQGMGRTHRNNQVSAPSLRLATSDIPGVAISNTRVVRKMASLGAISMGHREATGRTLFDGIDDFDSVAAAKALTATTDNIKGGRYPDLTQAAMAAALDTMNEDAKEVATTRTMRFFKKLRMAPLDFQRKFIEKYLACYEALDERIRNHVEGSGPYIVRSPMKVLSEETIYQDGVSDETIEALRLQGTVKPEYTSYKDALADAEAFCMPGETPRVRYKKSDQRLFILAKVDTLDLADLKKPIWRVYTPDGVDILDDLQRQVLGGAPPNDELNPVDLWDANMARIREINERAKILVRGAILRIVPVIAETNARQRLVIVPTEDGRQVAGYMIDNAMLERIRIAVPELARQVRDEERKTVVDATAKGCRVKMSNNMVVERMVLTPDLLAAAPQGGYDPQSDYVTVTVDAAVSTQATRRWIRQQGMASIAAVGSREIYAIPMARVDDVMLNLLTIADPVDFDAP